MDTAARDNGGSPDDRPAAEASAEFRRFLTLFDWLVRDTSKWIAAAPEDLFDWIPIDNANVRFGDRVTKVSIRSLFVHQLIAMDLWTRELKTCAAGAVIPVASDRDLAQKLGEGDLLATAARMHEANMARLETFTAADLDKPICFPGDRSTWTAMGFLWAMYGHHAFHLGNIDLYVRQGDVPAPDIFTFEPRVMA
ncbi:MAG: DinB family protein [Bauldia litoralis]